MDQTAVKLESLERSGNADVQVIEASQIIDANQNNGLVANQLATSGIQLVQANQATSGSLPWVLPPQYQMMLLSPGMSQNIFNNGNLLTLQDGHVLVTPVSDSGQLADATAQSLQQTQTTLIPQKSESEMVSPQQTIESQVIDGQFLKLMKYLNNQIVPIHCFSHFLNPPLKKLRSQNYLKSL